MSVTSFIDTVTYLVSARRAQPDLEVVDGLGKSEGNSPLEGVFLAGGWGSGQTLLRVLRTEENEVQFYIL